MRVAFENTVIPDHPVMKKAQEAAERIWKKHGRTEGVTITTGKNGIHSAGSWHYYGAAADLRTLYQGRQFWNGIGLHDYPRESIVWGEAQRKRVYLELKAALPGYDVIWHDTHIHVEPGNTLAKRWGLLL